MAPDYLNNNNHNHNHNNNTNNNTTTTTNNNNIREGRGQGVDKIVDEGVKEGTEHLWFSRALTGDLLNVI